MREKLLSNRREREAVKPHSRREKPLFNLRERETVRPDERKPSSRDSGRIANIPLDGKISSSADLFCWLLSEEQKSSLDMTLDFVVAAELENKLANFDFGYIEEQLDRVNGHLNRFAKPFNCF